MSSRVNDLLRRRNDPGYLNWLAVADALMFLSDGLRPHAENKMKELHALITTNVGGPGVRCPCSWKENGKKSKSNPHGGRAPCAWAQQLKNFHNFSNKNAIPWHQSLSSQWHDPVNGYWEIAKLFMCALGKNWATVKDAKCTDVGPLLNLLRFCKYFKIQHSSLDAVKDWRNKCAHAPERTLSDIDKRNAFKDIEILLNDPELTGIKEVQDVRSIIKKTETADISILQNDELKIIQEFSRECQIETQAEIREVSEKIDKLEGVVNELTKSVYKLFEGAEKVVRCSVSAFPLALLFAVSFTVRKIPGMLWSLMVFYMFSQVGERNVMIDYGKVAF